MKKNLHFGKVLIMFLSLTFGLSVQAQDAATLKKQANDAKAFVNSSVTVIKAAVSAKKANKKDPKSDEPFIGIAFEYQKKAAELYNDKNYEGAIYHAIKARKVAMMAIKQHKGDIEDNHKVDSEKVFKNYDKDKAFHKVLKSEMKNLKTMDIPSIDGQLTPGVGDGATDPDVKNAKGILEMEKTCKVK